MRNRIIQKPLTELDKLTRIGAGDKQPGLEGLAKPNNHTMRAVCTIASKNYLSLVRAFSESMANSNPEILVYVLLVDLVENKFNPAEEPFHLITISELENIPNPNIFFFKYDPIELNTAVKPYFLEYLFREYKLDKICYFDPDIIIFSELDYLWDLLETHSIVVTPHITSPYEDNHHPTEIEINLAGIFNLGFIGVSNTADTADFLGWWKIRLYDYCFMDPSSGMYVDQKWVNFAPTMYDGVFILRDPAYNIAYWNLNERGKRLRFNDGKLYIDHRQAVFFHFSGLDLANIEAISKHQDRYSLSYFPNIKPLFEFYRDLLNSKDYSKIIQWPYAYGRFDNGASVPKVARSLFCKLNREQMSRFGNPFATSGSQSYYSWINQPAGNNLSNPQPILTHLHLEIYETRLDLQKAFPDPQGADRLNFAKWLRRGGVKDFNLSSDFIPAENTLLAGKNRWLNLNPINLNQARSELYSFRQGLKKNITSVVPKNNLIVRKLRELDKKFFGNLYRTNLHYSMPAVQSSLPFGVNVAGYINGEFGVAEGARASIRSLISVNIPAVINNVSTAVYRHEDQTFGNISDSNPYSVNLVHVNADQSHEFARQKGQAHFEGRYNIGYWFWELSHFPKHWSSSFDYYQEIWVASTFCQESIAKVSPVPVVKMTFPVIVEENHIGSNRSQLGLPEDKFLFGYIFDYLSFFERKNPLGVIHAFRKAFEKCSDTALVIKTINSEHAPDKIAILKDAAQGCNIHFIDGYITRQEMTTLIASFDSFVSLHRSEGFGIGLAQAMLLRKPVIATGYSGNMEFMNLNNSFLVRYKLVEIEKDYGPYEKGNEWAEPDIEHASELMQIIFNNQTLSQQVALRAEADIKSKMTFELAGKEMKERLLLVT